MPLPQCLSYATFVLYFTLQEVTEYIGSTFLRATLMRLHSSHGLWFLSSSSSVLVPDEEMSTKSYVYRIIEILGD